MTSSPAVSAIQQVARRHLTAEMSLLEQRRIMVRMYGDHDRAWIQAIQDLDRRIEHEQQQRIDAAQDARAIATEDRR